MLPLHDWTIVISCIGHLALAMLVILRGSRGTLSLPLALLCIDFFLFNGADVVEHRSTWPVWVWIDVSAESMLPAVGLHFVLGFVGLRRRLRPLLVGMYAICVGLVGFCVFVFLRFGLWDARYAEPHGIAMIVVGMPTAVLMVVLLVLHLRRATTVLERARTYLVLAAALVTVFGGGTDLLVNINIDVPRLVAPATLLSTLLLATVAFRLGLLEKRVSALLAIGVLIFSGLQVLAYLIIYRSFAQNRALLVAGTVTVTALLLPVLRAMTQTQSAQRERVAYLTTLGRFSAQMAHDLRNPLAAAQGAVQFLDEERRRGSSLAEHGQFLTLILEQLGRLNQIIADYQRLGRVQAERTPLSLDELVKSTLSAQSLAAPAGVTLRTELGGDLPSCPADRGLLATALENLVRNAYEAMPDGGTLTVRTRRGPAGALLVDVEDTGQGMDARVRERAFEDFYTTKAKGSGLGLAFVKRVAEAHGGDATLVSELGRGTTVTLRLLT